jgi:hypothetical protein
MSSAYHWGAGEYTYYAPASRASQADFAPICGKERHSFALLAPLRMSTAEGSIGRSAFLQEYQNP